MTTINKTTWTPGCGCIIEYEWDGDIAVNPPHTAVNVLQRCPEHPAGSVATLQEHYDNLLGEHRKREWTKGTLLENFPNVFGVTDVKGNLEFRDDIAISVQYNGSFPNRILTITIGGLSSLTANQKTVAQQKVDQKFGAGKVTLVFT